MINNNHKNPGCGFAEELVSYLYGEGGAAETAAFETHLESCRACADELEAFSGVHFSINDWKLKEFSTLETPAIEIPYETAEKPLAVPVVKGSWLSALRDLFSLSPRALTLATASAAVLVFCVGIVWLALNPRTENDLAAGNRAVRPVGSATVEKTPEPVNPDRNNAPDKVVKPLNEPKAPPPEAVVEPNAKTSRAVKTSNNQRQTPKAENTSSPKSNDVKNNKKNNKDAAPVIPDEDEDDTLRLAELFDEIDADE